MSCHTGSWHLVSAIGIDRQPDSQMMMRICLVGFGTVHHFALQALLCSRGSHPGSRPAPRNRTIAAEIERTQPKSSKSNRNPTKAAEIQLQVSPERLVFDSRGRLAARARCAGAAQCCPSLAATICDACTLAVCGAGLPYGATHPLGVCGTKLAYGAMHPLG
eukprot:1100219-Rhodomonas_salina.1